MLPTTTGERMRAEDAARAQSDIQCVALPMLLPLALDDGEDVSRGAVLACQELVALLPRDTAAAAAQAAIHRLESQGAEDAAVQAARVFAHTAASWSEAALRERAPELLRRWCSHRNFTVREAMACCMSLVGDQLPLDVWRSALLPWFLQLCRDNNWRVRRAAALDLPRLAGKLHSHLQQLLHHINSSTVAFGAGSGAAASGCGGPGRPPTDPLAPCCRTSGVALEPLDVSPTGGCAYISTGCTEGYGARRRQPGTVGLVAPSVWSVHVQRPPPAASSSGAASMGKHPLSSSLLVDDPPRSASASSSLSSSDERPLALSPSDVHTGGVERERPAAEEPAVAASSRLPADAADEPAPVAAWASAPTAAQPCALEQQQPGLHACWAALRECIDCVTADSSHWVKVTALSGLGPCLVALPPCQVSGLLLGRFVAMGSSTTVIYEISVALACAQSFGLVASRLGAHRWPDVRCGKDNAAAAARGLQGSAQLTQHEASCSPRPRPLVWKTAIFTLVAHTPSPARFLNTRQAGFHPHAELPRSSGAARAGFGAAADGAPPWR
jgi:hypothetical protein